jgi:Delta6-protoilludene synthase
VQEYCWSLGQWVTANVKWSFKTPRYFGKDGLDIMKHRKVALLPKIDVLSRNRVINY